MPEISKEHIELRDSSFGPKACIKGSRIRVIDIVLWHDKMMKSVWEIVHDYPQLTPADVYAALAYYWDHREEIEAYTKAADAFVKEMKTREGSVLIEKLQRLRSE